MVALTQEKREELIAYANAAIKECGMHGEDYTPRPEMMIAALKVALASLTAEPKKWVIHAHGGDQFTTDGYYVANAEGIHGLKATPLFTAPPLPEIKFPGISALVDHQGCLPAVRDVAIWDFAISEVKRLNGWGE